MKVGLIILCRYNSNRLPGKILKKIHGKEVLAYILERLSLSKYAAQIVLATSNEADDNPIENYCKQAGIPCYRGSKNNVAQRFLDCALQFNFDYAVRVNGDNILLDAKLIDQLIDIAIKGNYDFVSNVKNRTYSEGISVEIIKTSFYKKSISLFNQSRFLEHVTLYFYENEIGNYYFHFRPYTEELPKLALDTEADFHFISQLIAEMKGAHTRYFFDDILKLANTLKNS